MLHVISSMPDLSSAANAIAVVGLADVVFRLSIEAADLYSKCRNASKSISRLQDDLRTLADIVAQVRTFATDYGQSPFVQDDSQDLMPELETILGRCERELEEIKKVAENAEKKSSDGWYMQIRKGLTWAFDDKKISELCLALEKYKATLHTTLLLTGR